LSAFTSLAAPVVSAVSPNKGYVATPALLTISGSNFGPATSSGLAPKLEVFVGSFACTNPVVTVQDTTIQCTAPNALGAGQVIVLIDDVSSSENVIFTNFADAGVFELASIEYNVLETSATVDIAVQRQASAFLSAASVKVSLYDGTATTPDYITAAQVTVEFAENQDVGYATFTVNAASRTQVGPRKGIEDDRVAFVRVDSAHSEFGMTAVDSTPAPVYVRAICEVVTDTCYAGFGADGVSFFRLDEYDQV
jgi:hypothetical protein